MGYAYSGEPLFLMSLGGNFGVMKIRNGLAVQKMRVVEGLPPKREAPRCIGGNMSHRVPVLRVREQRYIPALALGPYSTLFEL